MFYTNYHGRSVGRIYGYLEICHSLDMAERATVENGKVTYNGKLICTFTWEGDSDTAIIKFIDKGSQIEYIKKIDKLEIRFNISYAIQEVCRFLRYNLGDDEIIKENLKKWLFIDNVLAHH